MADKIYSAKSYLRHLWLARRGGHGVHSPFAYALCENVFFNSDRFYEFDRLTRIRQQLLADSRELNAGDFGAGSKAFKKPSRQVKALAESGISTRAQSEILYKLA